MKNKLHILLIAMLLCTVNLVSAQESVNQIFDASGDWYVDDKPGGSSAVSGGHLNVTMGDQGGGKFRADLKFEAGTTYTINSTTDKIIAVKFIGDKPASGAFKVELHIKDGNWINNGGGKYSPAGPTTTTAGNNIYYFDFSADSNYAVGDLEIDRINFTIADVTEATDYVIDWVATFENTSDLEAYKDTKDDGAGDTEGTTLGVNDALVKTRSFKLRPNPSTNNVFSIDLNEQTQNAKTLKVYNLLGGLILDKAVESGSKTIRVNHNLKAGIYLVKLNNSTQKLVVK